MDDAHSRTDELEILHAKLAESAAIIARDETLHTRLMSCLNHDFRTPLNAILSLSQIMLDRMDGELTAEQEKQVQFMRKGALDLTAMINDLLDLAKAGSRATGDAAEKTAGKMEKAAAPAAGKRKILMIDDSEADRYVFRRSMTARGDIAVLEAESGARGLDRARQDVPDCIILDLNLPDMSSYDILRDLSENEATKNIPVIIHSSMVLRDSEREFLLARARCIVSKDPAHAEDFKAALDGLLNEKPVSAVRER